MTNLIKSDLFLLALNLGVYLGALWFIRRTKIKYLTPLLVAFPIVATIITLLDIDYQTYKEGNQLLNLLLGPSVVALGYLIHKNASTIKHHLLPLLASVTIGALINSITINFIFSLLEVDPQIIISIHPKSVTTPIALELSRQLGGITSITVLSVVIAGIFGSTFGVPLLDILRVKKPIARGAALGAGAHAIGTSRAIELGEYEGAISGLTIGLMGAITALILPYIHTWLAF